MTSEFSPDEKDEIFRTAYADLLELGIGLKGKAGTTNLPFGLHHSFRKACNAFRIPSITIRAWRDRECLTLSCSSACIGIGFTTAPVVTYRHLETNVDLQFVPFFVREDGMNICIDYRLIGGGAHHPGDLHTDGTACIIDLRSITVHFDMENVGFPGNVAVAKWDAECVGQTEACGKAGSGLDDNFIISLTAARPKRADGRKRPQERVDAELVPLIVGNSAVCVTYGKLLTEFSKAREEGQLFADYVKAVFAHVERMKAADQDRAKASVAAQELSRRNKKAAGKLEEREPPAVNRSSLLWRQLSSVGSEPNPVHPMPKPTRPVPQLVDRAGKALSQEVEEALYVKACLIAQARGD
jgi:hypothetical protein